MVEGQRIRNRLWQCPPTLVRIIIKIGIVPVVALYPMHRQIVNATFRGAKCHLYAAKGGIWLSR